MTGLTSCALSANENKEYLYFSSLKKHLLKNHKEYYHEVFNKMTKVDIHAFSRQVDSKPEITPTEQESPKNKQLKNSSNMLPLTRKAKKDAQKRIHHESRQYSSGKSELSDEKPGSSEKSEDHMPSQRSLSYHGSLRNEPVVTHQLEPQESNKVPSKVDYQSMLLPQDHIKEF